MYLKNLSTDVTRDGDHLTVTYSLNGKQGTCKYLEKSSMSKLQPGVIHLLVEVGMTEIIEELNKETPLSDGDLTLLQMEIREDSLDRLIRSLNV